MAYSLATLARAAGVRRKRIVIRDIPPPAMMATALYRAC